MTAQTTALAHSAYLTGRQLRALYRMPVFLVISLIQPVIWLLLFGQLFSPIVKLPGFGDGVGNFSEFLTPGVVMMTALFSSAWAGTTYVQDAERGVMDRLLASPVSRGAMMTGTLAYQAVVTVIQTLVIVGIALAVGARFPGGAGGVGVMLVAAVLLSLIISALSNATALLTRQQEALIGISQLITLPLMFLSSAIMDTRLSPDWLRQVARYNPVEWATVAARQALQSGTDWGVVWTRFGLLAALALVMGFAATRAFRAYQRST